MNEGIRWITNQGKLAKNEWENDSDFLPALYIIAYNKLGESFSILYLLTCLNKDTSVLLQVIIFEHVNKWSIKTFVFGFSKILCICA